MTDAPERLCFVNCGLPADQCACYRQMMQCESRASDPDLEAHIGAVLEEAVEIVECGCGEDGCEMPFSCARKEAERIRALRTDAMQALERVRREARVEGMRAALAASRKAREQVIHSGERRYIDGISKGHDRAEDAIRALIAAEERGEGET